MNEATIVRALMGAGLSYRQAVKAAHRPLKAVSRCAASQQITTPSRRRLGGLNRF